MAASPIVVVDPDSLALPEPSFDYAGIPAEKVARQQDRAVRIRRMYAKTLEMGGEIGLELIEAQMDLGHGKFLPWVTEAVGLTKSTAYRCMDLARSFGSKLPVLGSLPHTVVYKLAQQGTPPDVRDDVVRRIEAGEIMEPDKILNEVQEARKKKRQAAAAVKEEVRRAKLTPEERDEEDKKAKRSRRSAEQKERERQEIMKNTRQESEAKEAAAAEAARILLDALGADRAADFSVRYKHVIFQLFDNVTKVAQIERAKHAETVMLRDADIVHTRMLGNGSAYWTDREQVEQLAEEIRRDGLREPIIVESYREEGRRGQYRVVDGSRRYRAVFSLLNKQEIEARIAPPIRPASDSDV